MTRPCIHKTPTGVACAGDTEAACPWALYYYKSALKAEQERFIALRDLYLAQVSALSDELTEVKKRMPSTKKAAPKKAAPKKAAKKAVAKKSAKKAAKK